MISIHALLAESDRNGYPHTRQRDVISIHALLAESDKLIAHQSGRLLDFYPRSPCGERLPINVMSVSAVQISIHALLAESDNGYPHTRQRDVISIHALLAESDWLRCWQLAARDISIHALLAESDSKSAQNSGALLRIWNKFYGDCIFMLTGKAVFYPFCPCFFHIFWCEGTGNFMIAFPSH